MRRYRKLNRYAAVVVLGCFFLALTGLHALAGQTCCGNCADNMPARSVHAPAMTAADGCGPDSRPMQPVCACTFQSNDDQDQRVYSLTRANTTSDNLLKGWTVAVATRAVGLDNPQAGIWTVRIESRTRSGPIYLANQSLLC